MNKILYPIIVFIGVSLSAAAQTTFGAADQHFSMYNAAPLLLNPAMTGAFEGNVRLTGLYRDEWGAVLTGETVPAYSTPAASLDFRTNKGFARGDAFGIGLYMEDEAAGESKFSTLQMGLSIAYHKSLDKKNEHFLSLGFSSGMWDRSINYVGLIFPGPFFGGSINIPTGSYIVDNRFLFWDVSLGLMYTGRFGKRSWASGYIGFGIDHVNTPGISFLGDATVKLPIKYTVHGGYDFPVTERFSLEPHAIYMRQGTSNELNFGSDVRMLFKKKEREGNNFKLGAMFRMVGSDGSIVADAHSTGTTILAPESVILEASVEFYHVVFSAAYDINVSQLTQATNSAGAFELGLSWTGVFNTLKEPAIFVPKFN